jgi:hypothetical protein
VHTLRVWNPAKQAAHFGVLFIYLFAIACFRSLSLGANDFGNLQELDFQEFEQQPTGEQGK